MEPVKVGLIGCGVISAAYLEAARTFEILDFVACADLDPLAAKATAEAFRIQAFITSAAVVRCSTWAPII